ncbi:MAG TPA: hypothetical protein PL000_14205 [Anaerolineales bacterium]|nr:hypothetical protein [Anaerolineales bacterium]
MRTPSAFGTSPKYDDSELGKFCRCFIVVFGGGRVGAALRELQSQSQEELDALLPSVLDRVFKGEL